MGTSREEMIRLVLADDDSLIREGIRAVLGEAPDVQIVGEAQDGRQTQQLTVQLCPRVLLLDWQMPGPRPPEVVRFVRTHCPGTKVLVMTGYDRDAYLAEMIDAGAAGYLIKPEMIPSRLIEAIRRAARGEVLFDGQQLERARRWREEAGQKLNSLSKRERQVLKLLAQGLDNKAIAETLGVTPKAAAFHVGGILGKLEVPSRQAAIVWVHTYLPDDLRERLD